jgi:16S rRNA (guanine527-N7)-methyltransferase
VIRASPHRELLISAGVPDARVELIARYLELLSGWAKRTNLTATSTPGERVRILVAPVLAGQSWIPGKDLLDVGSGNGSPGIVLALLAPHLRVVLLEPRLKRWAFLREACRALGRNDIDVRRERLEDYAGPETDCITLRALSIPASALERRLRPGGRILVWGEPLLQDRATALVRVDGPQQPLIYEFVPRETSGA